MEIEIPELGDITHIERPNLPWRSDRKTECGLDADRHPTWTREEAFSVKADLGSRRFMMLSCMTCASTADRHTTWEEDPASCITRHASRMGTRYGKPDTERRLFADELRAIAALVEYHREEFDALVRSLQGVVYLKDRKVSS